MKTTLFGVLKKEKLLVARNLIVYLSSSSTVATKVKNLILILSMIYDLRLGDFQKM
jgi:hypothetical protein